MEYKISIIGFGWVGKAMGRLFPDALVYDPALSKASEWGGEKQEVNKCDIAFICVPTPNLPMGKDEGHTAKYPSESEGALDTSIVEEVVAWCTCPLIVLRSTVNPGTCEYLSKKYKKHIVMQPEYLGETKAHPMFDMKQRPFMIIGGAPKNRRKLIDLYTTVYNSNINIRQVTNYEAEVIKLSENRAIAFKVAQCQELYDVCETANISYYTIREAVYGDDPRFNLWHTFVFTDKRGMNSKCIPKDVYAWCAWAESLGYDPKVTRGLLEKNKEWIKNKKN